jgi:hypothetical protein
MLKHLLGIATVVGIAIAACYPQGESCDYQYAEYCAADAGADAPLCLGHLIDPNTWQSGPLLGSFLNFGPNMNWHMHLRDGVTNAELLGQPYIVYSFVSPEAVPNTPGNQFAGTAGNLGEYNLQPDGPDGGATGGWTIDVNNDTCAQYYVYLVVLSTGGPALADAGTDAASEASTDAASE